MVEEFVDTGGNDDPDDGESVRSDGFTWLAWVVVDIGDGTHLRVDGVVVVQSGCKSGPEVYGWVVDIELAVDDLVDESPVFNTEVGVVVVIVDGALEDFNGTLIGHVDELTQDV